MLSVVDFPAVSSIVGSAATHHLLLRLGLLDEVGHSERGHRFDDVRQQQPVPAVGRQVRHPLLRLRPVQVVIGPVGVDLQWKTGKSSSGSKDQRVSANNGIMGRVRTSSSVIRSRECRCAVNANFAFMRANIKRTCRLYDGSCVVIANKIDGANAVRKLRATFAAPRGLQPTSNIHTGLPCKISNSMRRDKKCVRALASVSLFSLSIFSREKNRTLRCHGLFILSCLRHRGAAERKRRRQQTHKRDWRTKITR